jgi:hypothetical protein
VYAARYGVFPAAGVPHNSIHKKEAPTSEATTKEAAQRAADFCSASCSLTATTAPLKKAQKIATMSSPRYVSASEEIMAAGGVGTLGTRTTSFGWLFTIALLSLGGKESGSSPRH